jgi:hypothetical protein
MFSKAKAVASLLTLLAACGAALAGCGDQIGEATGSRDGSSSDGSDGGGPASDAGTFTSELYINKIGKIDLLFDIDNSSSMGDKQAYLEQAIPDLINRLVNPNCLDATSGAVVGPSSAGSCAAYAGTFVEFPPTSDMHVGIISSSLGTRGVTGSGAVCDPTSAAWNTTGPFADGQPALNTHVDDQGELLNRAAGTPNPAEDETPLADVGGQYFLDWFPNVAANDGKTADPVAPVRLPVATVLTSAGGLGVAGTLEGDFGVLVAGVHVYGCGIESQIETWYRFLIQPDPYASIEIDSSKLAVWQGVDATIIEQRHDFLRPDSLVVILDLTDENDSEIDVRSVGGSGYLFMDSTFNPPRATSACASQPSSSACTSCAAGSAPGDPSCSMNGGVYSADNDWGFYINVRHVHMQQKYGLSAQFPLQRYVLGLTSSTVPDRDHEYPPGAISYQGGTQGDPADLNCKNPLFAATLPDGSDLTAATLCNASAASAPRSPNLVFYAHVGGVPHQLLQAKVGVDKNSAGNVLCPTGTNQADCPQKDVLTVADWTKILGKGTATGGDPYDYTGIDPHMIEAYEIGRTGTNYADGTVETIPMVVPAASPTGGGPDPINGGDWATDVDTPNPHPLPVDREYACIFPLAAPRDCSQADDPLDAYACTCDAVGLIGTQVPPVCGLQNPSAPYSGCTALGSCSKTNDYLTQYYAKAYPTIRELELALMLGPQGVISSLCPIHVKDEAAGNDPVYGYRPAVTAILDRLRVALEPQCLPQPLEPTQTAVGQEVPCLVLATLPNTTSGTEDAVCSMSQGLSVPAASVLATFNREQHAKWEATMTGVDLSTEATCEIDQLAVPAGTTCIGGGSSGHEGWCYVTGAAAGACQTQAIVFTPGTPPNGATVNLECALR